LITLSLGKIQQLSPADRQELLHYLKKRERIQKQAPYALFKPYPGWQADFWRSTARIRVAHCGNRTGKSYVVIANSVQEMYKVHPHRTMHYHKPYMRIRVVGKDEDHCLDEWVKTLHEFVPAEDIVQDYVPGKSKNRRIVLNEEKFGPQHYWEFMTYGMEARQFASVEREHTIFDEVPPRDIYYECSLRMMAAGGTLDIAATPEIESSDPSFFRELIEQLQADERAEIFCGSMFDAARSGVVDYSVSDVEQLERDLPEDQARARIDGELVNVGGIVFKEYSDRFFTDDPPGHLFDPQEIWPGDDTRRPGLPPRDWQIVSGLDPSVNGFTGCLWCAISPQNQRFYFAEYYERDKVISQHAASILEIDKSLSCEPQNAEQKPQPFLWRVIDPAAESSIQYQGTFEPVINIYAKNGVFCFTDQALRDEPARIDKVRNALLFNAVEGARQPEIYISKDCPVLRRQLKHVSYETWTRHINERNPKQKTQDKDNHLTDCLGYVEGVCPGYMKDPPAVDRDYDYEEIGY